MKPHFLHHYDKLPYLEHVVARPMTLAMFNIRRAQEQAKIKEAARRPMMLAMFDIRRAQERAKIKEAARRPMDIRAACMSASGASADE